MITDVLGTDNAGNGVNRFSELKSEDFVRIMFTELQNQDPTEPQDSSKLMDQINSLRSIESNMELMSQIGDLVSENRFASASNMIGKFVVGRNEELQGVQGTVVSAGIEDDEIILTLDSGERMPFDNVEHVELPGNPDQNG